MKTCIAYFSKTGGTENAAKYLSEKIGAELIRLEDTTNYSGFIGFMKGGFRASVAKQCDLDLSVYDTIASFDRIILATPVWAGKTTPAINSVLGNVDFTGKTIYAMTLQADPDLRDADLRGEFYKNVIEKKGGTFGGLFALVGSSTNKPPKSIEEIKGQIDEKVVL